MYVDRYLCIYVSMYLCIYVSMYLCIYVSMYLCIYVSMYLCIYVSTYLCIYVSMYLCIYVSIYLCISVLVDMMRSAFFLVQQFLYTWHIETTKPVQLVLYRPSTNDVTCAALFTGSTCARFVLHTFYAWKYPACDCRFAPVSPP
jgi:hypothetical protein